MSLTNLLFGGLLRSFEETGGKAGTISRSVSIFGLDALSSAAYGPEGTYAVAQSRLRLLINVAVIGCGSPRHQAQS